MICEQSGQLAIVVVLQLTFGVDHGPGCASGERLRVINKHCASAYLGYAELCSHIICGTVLRLMVYKRWSPAHFQSILCLYVILCLPPTRTHAQKAEL